MKINIGISDKNRKGVNDLLYTYLSDLHVLYIKTRNYHWNVKGDSFMEKHKLLEDQYGQLEEIIDETAERIRTLGGEVDAKMASFLKSARLKESGEVKNWKDMFNELLTDHETLCKSCRDDISNADKKFEDLGTADFFTSKLEEHEKITWFLRSYLE
jgi:starvation-inducible DNA-binding protein